MGELVSEEHREKLVREAFAVLADEFLDRVQVSESGSLTVHYQNGVPLKRDYSHGGRIHLKRLTQAPEP